MDSGSKTEVPTGHTFALCLSHDVDRIHKTYQGLFYGLRDRSLDHLRSLFTNERPYWGFDEVMRLEEELGVRSAFYFLNEKRLLTDTSPRTWLDPRSWFRYNYYDIGSAEIRSTIRDLEENGWEIGLHGSYDSFDDYPRLAYEKATLDQLVEKPIRGGRQHFLNLDPPGTWRHHRDIGLRYDSSLGSGEEFGFQHGYGVKRPFDDDFVVFPLTAMDQAVMATSDDVEEVWTRCKRLLDEAIENEAVMSIDWHQRVFNDHEFPGWGTIYRRIVEYALDHGAWVGPPGDLYELLVDDADDVDETDEDVTATDVDETDVDVTATEVDDTDEDDADEVDDDARTTVGLGRVGTPS